MTKRMLKTAEPTMVPEKKLKIIFVWDVEFLSKIPELYAGIFYVNPVILGAHFQGSPWTIA